MFKQISLITAVFTALLGLTFSMSAHAADDTPQKTIAPFEYTLSYNVYAGGFKALNATYTGKKQKNDDYSLELQAVTTGFIGDLFPWSIKNRTIGAVQDTTFVPTTHTSTSSWKADDKVKKIGFKGGDAVSYSVTEHKKTISTKPKSLTPKLTENTDDVLTAALNVFQNIDLTNLKQGCNANAMAFDGKRKFKISLKDGEVRTLRKSKYSSFSGPALKCTVHVEPIAGFREKDMKRGWMVIQKHTVERGKPPAIWLAQVQDNGPIIPVRMQVDSKYGAVIAHLTDIKIPTLDMIEAAAGANK